MTEEQIPLEQPKPAFSLFPFFKKNQAAVLLVILAIIFYSPSFNNEYALDDGIVIHQNDYVIKGVRGITEILSEDAYSSFYKRMNATDQLQGGRYRPLAAISYALEQEIIGPYRTGHYMMVEDHNHNGALDDDKVSYLNFAGKSMTNYEYNNYEDLNKDGKASPNECYNCWDENRNFGNDPEEDLNVDGVYNEIDCQVKGAWLRHLDNILLYALCCLLVYVLFANYFFSSKQDLAFFAALLFTIHPVHSEVVANVRGRDDILSMIFIALTFIYAFKYQALKKYSDLALSSLMFFLALMSKEYGFMLFIMLPLALWCFAENRPKLSEVILPIVLLLVCGLLMILIDLRQLYILDSAALTFLIFSAVYAVLNFIIFKKEFIEHTGAALISGLGIATIVYMGFRLNAVNFAPGVPDTEILNNPYLLASPTQAFATKIYALLIYLRLSLWPHPLVSDYSYGSIPYKELTDPQFILSLLLHAAVLITGIFLSIRKHLLGFAIITYFAFLLVVSNLFFLTGIMMLESFLFHASLGICIVLAWIFTKILQPNEQIISGARRLATASIVLILVVMSGIICRERSKDWKNDVTLFFKDVHNAPNSVLVLGNAGARWIDLADTKEITGIVEPGANPKMNDYNGTLKITEEEVRLGGYADKRETALNKGIGYLHRAVELHPRYVNGYLNLGLAYFKLQKEKEAILYWKLAERLYPNNPYLNNYYQVYSNMLRNRGGEAFAKGDNKTALKEYNKLCLLLPDDAESWSLRAGACYNLGHIQEARQNWTKSLELNPNNSDLKKTLEVMAPDLIHKFTHSKESK